MKIQTEARPFVKWAGGKQASAVEIVRHFPKEIGTYYEPFLGGGSVFFSLAPSAAVLADANRWLIDTYRAVRDQLEDVVAGLHSLRNTREEFARIRAIDPETLSPSTRAAHFIYLNKTCFRGLYRVNRNGRFNVPYGGYQRRYYDLEELTAVAERLRDVDLGCVDFEQAVRHAKRGDFIYFDPPYHKLGGYSDFNRYTPGQFREADHERLAALCRALDRRGVKWALSNSDTPFVRELFQGFDVTQVKARREINLKSAHRSVEELMIKND
jgi:DNA adenine methylase